MKRRIYEIREVRLTAHGLQWGPAIDAKLLVTHAAVKCHRLNQSAMGTPYRYVYRSEQVGG